MRRHLGSITAATALLVFVSAPAAAQRSRANAARPFRVGVVSDGPLTASVQRVLDGIKEEAKLLLKGGRRTIEFAPEKQVVGDWSAAGIAQANEQLLQDPDVDLIVVFGLVATGDMVMRPMLPKPVIAPLAPDPRLTGLPVEKGTSGKKNFNYLAYSGILEEDLAAFKKLANATTIHLLVDRRLHQLLPKIDDEAQQIGRKLKLQLPLIKAADTAGKTLERIPTDAQAVFLTQTPHLPDAERKKLFAGLNARKLPTFTRAGRIGLDEGALATQTQKVDYLRVSRRAAINIERIVRGQDPAKFSVFLRRNSRLIINMQVANSIGFSPNWHYQATAELYRRTAAKNARRLTLAEAMREAIKRNWDVLAAVERLRAAGQRVDAAWGSVWPQLDAMFNHETIRKGVADNSNGQRPWHAGTIAGRLNQFLYVEPVTANITIQKHNRRAAEADYTTVKLNIVAQVASAYLDLLRAKAKAEIERNNALLTGENLESAEIRRKVGTSGPSDVYRWQSQLADDRRRAIDAYAQVKAATFRLNELLRYPQRRPVDAAEPSEDDPTLLPAQQQLRGYLDNPRDLAIFSDFLVKEGHQASPELRKIDAQVAAQRRLYTSRARALWLPEFRVTGEISYQPYRVFGETGFTLPDGTELGLASPERFQWLVGAGLTFPLFTGFTQTAERGEAEYQLQQLEASRNAQRLTIESQIRTALVNAQAASAAIHFTRLSAEAARKNLRVMTEGFSRGVYNTVQLLDAQNNALLAEQAAATAVYGFLRTVVELQRSGGRFELFVSPDERNAWLKRLKEHFEQARKAAAHG